jgi:hypothetical protein
VARISFYIDFGFLDGSEEGGGLRFCSEGEILVNKFYN